MISRFLAICCQLMTTTGYDFIMPHLVLPLLMIRFSSKYPTGHLNPNILTKKKDSKYEDQEEEE